MTSIGANGASPHRSRPFAQLLLDDICSVLYTSVRINMTSVQPRVKEAAFARTSLEEDGRWPTGNPARFSGPARTGRIHRQSLVRYFHSVGPKEVGEYEELNIGYGIGHSSGRLSVHCRSR